MVPSFILTAFAGLLLLIAWIWLLVAAFRTSVLWGVVILLLGWTLLPVIVFAFGNWDLAKQPILLYAVGVALTFSAVLLVPMNPWVESPRIDPPAETDPGSTVDAETSLPTPRPSPMPAHPSWEEVVSEMKEESDTDLENLVPSPTPAPMRSSVLRWDELDAHTGKTVIMELRNNSTIEAILEEVTADRVRVLTNVGGGKASYWIEREKIVLIRLAN